MIAILWRYRVRRTHREDFERTYGPDGDWARLFRRAEGYLGTELLRTVPDRHPRAGGDPDPDHDTLTYLTIDRWRSQEDVTAFLAAQRAEYDALDAATEDWTVEEVKLGVLQA